MARKRKSNPLDIDPETYFGKPDSIANIAKEIHKNAKSHGWWNKQREIPDRKSTRLNSSHIPLSRMPASA